MKKATRILLVILTIVMLVPMCNMLVHATTEKRPYIKVQADLYSESFQSIFGSESASFATTYFNLLDSDKELKSQISNWEGIHIATEPSYFFESGLISKKDMYKLAIFEMLDANNADTTASEMLATITNARNSYVYDITNTILGTDDININELENFPVTAEYIDSLKSASNIAYMADTLGQVNTLLSSVKNLRQAVETLSNYQAIADMKDGTRDILYSIYQDANSPWDLKNAAYECISYFDDAYDNLLQRVISGTEPITSATFQTVSSIVFDNAWDNFIINKVGGGAILVGAKGIRVLANSVFDLDERNRAYYQLEACVKLENVIRRIMTNRANDYRSNPTLEKAVSYMRGVDIYKKIVLMGFDYSIELLQIQSTAPGQYEDAMANIVDIRNFKEQKKDNFNRFEEATFSGYINAFYSDYAEITNGVNKSEQYVYQWDISRTSSDKVIATLHNNSNGVGYKLIIAGSGAMKDWEVPYRISPWDYSYSASITAVEIRNGVTNIGNRTFRQCTSLTSITIPDSVETIGDWAFVDCTSLASVTIGDGVTSIGENAFCDCTNLTTVTIGDSVTSIGDRAFSGCESLESITIPDSVTSIGGYAFCGCTSLTSITIPDSVETIGYGAFVDCPSIENVTMPTAVIVCVVQYIRNSLKTVVITSGSSIADCAFANCTSLTSVTIGDDVTSIGEDVFNSCTSLVSITIPNSVTSMGGYAFTSCSSLTSVTIGDSVTSIGPYAFWGCTSLTGITIPGSVETIGEMAFYGCTSLTSVTIDDGVKSIGKQAFYGCTSLTSVTIGEGVTNIGSWAFCGCSNLTSIIIPDSVVTIEMRAFQACEKLENVTLGKNLSTISEGLFMVCKSLTTIIIPDHVLSIGDCSFSGTNLSAITIPDGVESIGYQAFYGCTNLTNITIPDSVTSMGGYVFAFCPCLTSVTIPDSITSIEEGTFCGCTSLTSVTIGDSVTSIGPYAFHGCSRLTNVTIPDSVTSIGDRAFYACARLTSVTIPDNMTSIGDYVFAESASLACVTIEKGIMSIGYAAFWNCPSLTSVTIGDSVTNIGDYAFYDCSSLTSVTIGDGVTSIGEWAFSYCTSLTSVTIPDSVTTIGENVFHGCSNLESIVLPFVGASVKTENDLHQYPLGYIFGENNYEGGVETTQHYYDSSLSTAVAVSYYIPSSLKSVTITGGNILRGAFGYCNNLTEVIISSNVTKIGDWAFSNCVNLKKVVLPQSVTKIGAGTFNGCSGLFGIELPNGVTRIGEKAFRNCGSLTSLAIPSSITQIDNNAFENCTNLRLIYMNSSSIASALTSSTACGNLLQNVQTIIIEKSNDNLANFVKDTFAYQETFLSAGVQFLSYSIHVHTWEAVSEEAACYRFERENCTVCGLLKEYTVWVEHDYNEEGICSVCGALCIKFSGASLTLEDNISVNFKVDPKQFEGTGYSNPYVIFAFNGNLFVTTEYTIDSNGRYAFAFSDIAPRMMNDSIIATLYATYEGKQVACQTRSYSVKEYCYNMLARCEEGGIYANNETFKALLVDLLNYGEAAQIYGNYQTETLVTSNLTEAQRNWATEATPSLSTVQNLTYQTIENPSVTWKAGGLLLEDAVTMRFKFATDSIDGLTVKFYTDNNPTGWILDDSSFVATSGGYYVYFDGLKARQMRETVYVTVYCGDTAISNTISYSIESYAYAKQNDSNEKLTVLLEAMMKYGDAAYKYING